jgi:putative ABC transport system permease protein
LAGILAGSITGFLHTLCKIPAILSGILTQLGLWTINMIIMGLKEGTLVSTLTIPSRTSKPLVSAMFLTKALDGSKPFYLYPPLVLVVFTALIIGILYWFFGTERGASLRATGANEHMARAQGINTNVNKMIGLMLANGLVALSGSLFAQYNGNAEINMGRGAIVIGLAAIIIGDVLFGKLFKNFAAKLLAVSFGAIIYYVVIQAVLTLLKVDSQYLKLMSAAIVAIFLTVPNFKGGHNKKHKKGEVKVCSK